MSRGFQSRFVHVGEVRTHYLEAGEGEPLILLHSGEFGACAELSWEWNIAALAEHFRVLAPDLLGFGETDKIFDFTDMFAARIRHVRRFLETLCIERAHFAGNSMSGGMLAYVASQPDPEWPIRRIILVSGGGFAPDNEARRILNTYDCTKEHMRRMLQVLFYHRQWWEDPYLERRYRMSLAPGSWECTAAARFRSPAAAGRPSRNRHEMTVYGNIRVPTWIVAGADDLLREPGYAEELRKEIAGSELTVFQEARHCPHIDRAEEFNRLAVEFLKEG